jgi:UDP-glucose 4-epimerase
VHVLLTGASSFTGFWFAQMLVASGANLLATLSGPDQIESYRDTRGNRVSRLKELCRTEFGAPFGSEEFLNCIRRERHIDVVCHHWSDVRNYKSADFDALAAAAANTCRFTDFLHILKDKGCRRIVMTGSVGEPDEGAGSTPRRAFNAYTLSKRISYELAQFYCDREGIVLDKFIIPNPFGPFEEPRFTHYLMTTWFAGETPAVMTPSYVRDNIHVDLLAEIYASFVLRNGDAGEVSLRRVRLAPSGYVETQGVFASRMSREVSCRLKISCPIECRLQQQFPEPPVRINTDVPNFAALAWNEEYAWDRYVEYYLSKQ